MNEHWPEIVALSDVLNDWTSPRVELADDARMGDDVYVLVEDIGEGRAWIEVHGRRVASALSWAEQRAAEMDTRRLLTGGWSTNAPLFVELDRRGYRRVRSSHRMEIVFHDPPPEPAVVAGIEIRPLAEGEQRVAYDVHQEAFEDVWEPMRRSYEDWAHWFLAPDRFTPELWLLAWEESEPCGVAMCHTHRTEPGLGWVDVLAVRRRWRRRGIGRALLLHAFGAFVDRGLTSARLGVDSDSPTGAHGVYEDAGMRSANQFDLYEKALR